jgi:hypothetical protein
VTEPLYLVCTNGRHDPCCAEYGRPVARPSTELVGERVWECSHVGGDRFAGNLVCLPDGVFYGHLDPATALRAVAAHEGAVLLEHWRGPRRCRSSCRRRRPSSARARGAGSLAGPFPGPTATATATGCASPCPTGARWWRSSRCHERTVPAGLTCAGTAVGHADYELVALER